jgi:hypothetical protein
MGGTAEKKGHTVRAMDIILQRQYFAARSLRSCVSNVFDLHSICVCFHLQSSDAGETQSGPGYYSAPLNFREFIHPINKFIVAVEPEVS